MADENPLRILASRAAAPRIVSELSRRRFLSLSAIVGGTAFLAACSAGCAKPAPSATGGKLEGSLSMYSWGDYDAPEVLKDFTKTLGPKLTVDSFGSNEELIAKLVAAKGTGGYDIIVPTGVYIPQMVQNNLLMKLNKDLIPNLEHMDPAYLGRGWDPKNEYSICKAWGTTGFVYDKTVITRDLKTWSDFLDCAQKEASGKTSVLDDPAEITGMYYWANGIDWNTEDDAEIDKCEDFIVNTLAPHIAAFDSYPGSGAIPQSSHALIEVWNGDARQGITNSDNPDKWQWVLGSPTTELWMDNWAICSTAPHPEAAHAFINFVLTPENAIKELDYIGYHTGEKDIQATAEKAGLKMLDLVFFTPEQLATMKDGEVNKAQTRTVDIYNKAKAAAGA
ncbi:MAG: spermidine/putrescine ABC transporter substrate-binding protein [Microbacterium sp.]|nr:spermidine/putrescine ABC transporter substrate-binding protein [Microbacterium sp.]